LLAEIAQYTADAVVPGVLFIGIAHHVLGDLAEFLKQLAIPVDALIRWSARRTIPPPDLVALCGVGRRESGEGTNIGTNRAALR